MRRIAGRKRLRSACAFVVTLGLGLGLAPRPAAAQASAQAAAEALFDEARKAMARGDLAQACPKFEESERLDPAAGTLFNLAVCYERSGKLASAWVTFRATASAAEKDNRAEWATKASKRAVELEPRLSQLTLDVPAAVRVPGLHIQRDDVDVDVGASEWGTPIPVDGGAHVVRVTAPAHAPRELTAEVAVERGRVTLTVPELVPLPPEAKPPPSVLPPEPSGEDRAHGAPATVADKGRRTLGFALGGVGIAALGVSGIFGLLAMNSRSGAAPDCAPDFAWCGDTGLARLDSARTQAHAATWLGVGGAALLAAGAIVVWTAPSRPASPAALHVTVTGSNTGTGGLALVGGTL